MKLGVLFAGQVHPWQDLVELVAAAEERGFDTAWVDGELIVRRLRRKEGEVRLVSDSDRCEPITFVDGDELAVWGVVTVVIHAL